MQGAGLERIARVDVLGTPVSVVTLAGTLATIDAAIAERRQIAIFARDVHGVVAARRNPDLDAAHRATELVTPDGMPLVWLLRALGHDRAERVCGPDLLPAACAAGLDRGHRHFFLGGTVRALDLLTGNLARRFPGLTVAGSLSPPFRPLSEAEQADQLARIDAARPDILWVGLGCPKQELWIARHRHRLEVPVLAAVGAAFDFHAGLVPRAPPWLRTGGLEWGWRLAREPRRLARRYLTCVPTFALLAAARLLRGRNTSDIRIP